MPKPQASRAEPPSPKAGHRGNADCVYLQKYVDFVTRGAPSPREDAWIEFIRASIKSMLVHVTPGEKEKAYRCIAADLAIPTWPDAFTRKNLPSDRVTIARLVALRAGLSRPGGNNNHLGVVTRQSEEMLDQIVYELEQVGEMFEWEDALSGVGICGDVQGTYEVLRLKNKCTIRMVSDLVSADSVIGLDVQSVFMDEISISSGVRSAFLAPFIQGNEGCVAGSLFALGRKVNAENCNFRHVKWYLEAIIKGAPWWTGVMILSSVTLEEAAMYLDRMDQWEQTARRCKNDAVFQKQLHDVCKEAQAMFVQVDKTRELIRFYREQNVPALVDHFSATLKCVEPLARETAAVIEDMKEQLKRFREDETPNASE